MDIGMKVSPHEKAPGTRAVLMLLDSRDDQGGATDTEIFEAFQTNPPSGHPDLDGKIWTIKGIRSRRNEARKKGLVRWTGGKRERQKVWGLCNSPAPGLKEQTLRQIHLLAAPKATAGQDKFGLQRTLRQIHVLSTDALREAL